MLRTSQRIPALLAVAAGLATAVARGQGAAPLPQWTPDKVLVKGLASAKDVGGYTIRPPKGFEPVETPKARPGTKTFVWAGARRQDGTRPSFSGLLYTPAPGTTPELALGQVFDKFLGGFERQHADWQAKKPEEGLVNGIRFVRARWKGTEKTSGAEEEGILYIARDGETIVQLGTQDVVPETKTTLPIAEAALLTFKKK